MTGRFLRITVASLAAMCLAAPLLRADPVPDVVSPAALPFDLADVRLLDGPFREAMLRDQAYLLGLDPDRLLHNFRVNVGIPSSATPYGGWEAPGVELRGHFVGHYLSACALMYESTGDARFKSRVDQLVVELAKCQAASPANGYNAGYLSAFPESFIDRVIARQNVWAPWYTLHKIMAGLLDANQRCGNAQALQVLTNMASWVRFRLDPLTTNQVQSMLDTEFGGMNEVLANLYAVTGNTNDLRAAKYFDHERMFVPLSQDLDILDGYHANTQIPKMIGAAREYELTGDAAYHEIADFFWRRVALFRSYVIGGHSDGESFFPINTFPSHLSTVTCETCNTYNMLKLSRHLFGWAADAAVMEFYERGLYNHILASQEPLQGMMTYYVPLKPGEFKSYSTPENSFWCCTGTGVENHAQYGGTIYFHTTNSLYVNLFIASEVHWREKGLVVRQETAFPQSNTTRLTVQATNTLPLELKIRYPAWARAGISITVNGAAQSFSNNPGSYVSLQRAWQNGDVVDIAVPLSLRTEALPGDTNLVALLYGPVVLAGALGDQDTAAPLVPLFVGDVAAVLSNAAPVPGQPLTFRTAGLGQPRDVTLIPFYQTHHQRYSVYWQVLSPQAWTNYANSNAVAEVRVADEVLIGNSSSESAHNLQQTNSQAGTFNGRNWRHAVNGGWFSYRLNVRSNEATSIVCTYWGSDSGGRVFDIVVDGQVIATQTLANNFPGQFFDVEYPIPQNLTSNKTQVTVRFQAHAGMTAGGVFGLRTVGALDPGALQTIGMSLQTAGGQQSVRVIANFQNLANHPILGSPWLVLTSSDENILTVGNNGLIRVVNDGTATITANYFGRTATLIVTVSRPRTVLRHRYSFNSTQVVNATNVLDSLNPADAALRAVLRGAAAVSGGQLVLNGVAGNYAELPAGIISNYGAVTIEMWVSFGTQPEWTYLFGFGDTAGSGAGAYGFSFTPHSGAANHRLWVTDTSPGSTHEFQINGVGVLDNLGVKHIAVVLDLNSGYLALYVDGALVGERSDVPFGMGAIHNVHSYLGRSLYTWDPYLTANIREVRVYEGALRAAEIAANSGLGPDLLLSDLRLQIGAGDGGLAILWPTNAQDFQLECTENLDASAVWVPVTNSPAPTGEWFRVLVPGDNTASFYRLTR